MKIKSHFLHKIMLFSLVPLITMYLISCSNGVEESALLEDTNLHEVNGAVVCDYENSTPTVTDDCNGSSEGYFYHPSTYYTFYRYSDGTTANIARQRFFSYSTGQPVRLNNSIITTQEGIPLIGKNNRVITRTQVTSEKTGRINTSPVRSTANFNHPSLGKISGGKTTSVSRGVSFGSRSGSFGG